MKIKGIYHMPGSKYLWYRWMGHDGKRRAVSLKTDDLSEAIKAVKRIQAGELITRWENPEPARTAATKLVESYLTEAKKRKKKPMRARTAKTVGYILRKYLTDTRITSALDIRYQGVERWLDKLKSEGMAPDSLNKYAMSLRPFFRYLAHKRLIAKTEVEEFEIPEAGKVGRKNWVRLAEANRVIAESKDPDLTFVLYCGFHAGLRKSEIINARVHWFDLGAGLLHAQNEPGTGYTLKDGDNRAVPLTKDFKTFLTRYLAGRDPNSYALKPEKENGKSDYRYDFKRQLYSHFKKYGVHCTIHDMRRSYASNLVTRAVSIYKVAKWLGDGVAVVERSYGHLAPSDSDIDVLSSVS